MGTPKIAGWCTVHKTDKFHVKGSSLVKFRLIEDVEKPPDLILDGRKKQLYI